VAQRAHELCRQWDTEGDGALHFSKLQAVLKEVCPEADEEELKTLISSVDINGDGVVQYEEFLRWLRFPPAASGVKMSFEDTLKSGMLDRIKLDQAGSKDDAMNPVAAEPDVRCAAKPSTDEEDDILMESFVHPLLDRFMVCKDHAADWIRTPRLDLVFSRLLGCSRKSGSVEMKSESYTLSFSCPVAAQLLPKVSQLEVLRWRVDQAWDALDEMRAGQSDRFTVSKNWDAAKINRSVALVEQFVQQPQEADEVLFNAYAFKNRGHCTSAWTLESNPMSP
ncbi:unnamed protein product, partial [Effrenium voratum]